MMKSEFVQRHTSYVEQEAKVIGRRKAMMCDYNKDTRRKQAQSYDVERDTLIRKQAQRPIALVPSSIVTAITLKSPDIQTVQYLLLPLKPNFTPTNSKPNYILLEISTAGTYSST